MPTSTMSRPAATTSAIERGGRRQVGVAGREERHQGAAAFALEAGEEGVDAVHAVSARSDVRSAMTVEHRHLDAHIGSPRSRATSKASLSPRPERQTTRTLPAPEPGGLLDRLGDGVARLEGGQDPLRLARVAS